MECGISSVKDIIEVIALVASTLGFGFIIYTILSYHHSIKSLNFNIITSCNSRFYDIVDDLYKDEPEDNVIRQYINLCHEEIFYFKEGYLRDLKIAKEWVDGMIDFMPLYYQNKCINGAFCTVAAKIDSDRMLLNYDDLKTFFTINQSIDFENLYTSKEDSVRREIRVNLIALLMKNL